MEKPIPQPGPGDAIVRTTRALICTSDSHTVKGGIGPRENLTFGHEAVGVVHEVGSDLALVLDAWFKDLVPLQEYPAGSHGPRPEGAVS